MAGETIALINSAAQVSSDAFNRIDRAMTQQLESNLRGGQFAVEMTAKAAQAAEEARMNDLKASSIKQENYIRGEQFAMEKAFLPLKIASMNLAMRAQEMNMLKQKHDLDKQNADQIFSTYDDRVGMQLLETENTDHAKEYLAWKAKWQTHVMQGGKFDPVAYQKGLDDMSKHFSQIPKTSNGEWSPENQFLFDNVSPRLGKAYEMKNPIIKKNKNGLAVGTLTMADNAFGSFWPQFGNMFGEEESGLIGMGRSVYQQNDALIEKKRSENGKLQSYLSVAGLEESDKKATLAQIAQNSAEMERAQKQNSLIMSNYSQGKYGVPADEADKSKGDQTPTINPTGYSKKPGAVLGFENDESPNVKVKSDKLNEIARIFGATEEERGKSEVGNIDLKWASDELTNRVDYDTLTSLRTRIESQIDSLHNIDDRFNRVNVDKLLKSTNKKQDIPISSFAAEEIIKTESSIPFTKNYVAGGPGGLFGGNYAKDTPHLTFGGSKNDYFKPGLNSYDDVTKMLSKIKDKTVREEVKKEVFASIITAAISNAVEAE